ncbi:hypothetical protein DDE73_30795 (plasmid) [Bacillus thuringiensis]|nr:hypothetical protein DDE73_30795 [Bacillus thuringiensis]
MKHVRRKEKNGNPIFLVLSFYTNEFERVTSHIKNQTDLIGLTLFARASHFEEWKKVKNGYNFYHFLLRRLLPQGA